MADDITIPEYDAARIEEKWQKQWEDAKLYVPEQNSDKPKKYILEMFPYPSGDLHMGHARNYTIGDAMARQAHMQGFNVLHPIGFDAFGLPAENAAIKHNTQAASWTYQNMDNALKTMRRMGFSYDFDHVVKTCDPSYYKWGQLVFEKMWEKGLVYRKKSPVNWCPKCQTVLANEQVTDGKCWRCDSHVEKRELEQWYLKITDYAQELLDDLSQLDGWNENVKQMQRNWIGLSQGAEVDFAIEGDIPQGFDEALHVFTTRPDTICGASFVLLAPEYPHLLDFVRGYGHEQEVQALIEEVSHVSSIDRQSTQSEKKGVFTGRYVINPVTHQRSEVWVANYVLGDYGTGAVMAVPASDARDFDFARKYNLAVIPVCVDPNNEQHAAFIGKTEFACENVDWEQPYTGEGVLVQSGAFSGMACGHDSQAFNCVCDWLEQNHLGKRCTTYRLRDWLVSRQRYWGNPIPAIHCEHCGIVPVPEKDLPVTLPETLDLGSGQTLETCPEFYETVCPVCGAAAKRETDTMDTFMDSSWYYLRYCDPCNDQAPFSKQKANAWMPVDNYVGGIEHAILHLLYSRFWTKVLRDLGMLDIDEPFKHLLTQGMVKDENGEVMSKSKGNVVPPSSVIDPYGADTMRLAILFIAPPEKDFDWDPNAVAGCNRFLKRAWKAVYELSACATRDESGKVVLSDSMHDELDEEAQQLFQTMHRLGIKATEDFERHQFNTAISAIMELVNAVYTYFGNVDARDRSAELCAHLAYTIVLMMAPICPYWSEELYHEALGASGFVYNASYPVFDAQLAQAQTCEMAVQVMGRVRAHITVDVNADEEQIKTLAQQAVSAQLVDKTIRKIIVVPKKIVNIVAN